MQIFVLVSDSRCLSSAVTSLGGEADRPRISLDCWAPCDRFDPVVAQTHETQLNINPIVS